MNMRMIIMKTIEMLLYIIMIPYTGFFVYSFGNLYDASNKMRKISGPMADQLGDQLISICIAYIINMFCLFCITKIIDFLFDLDKK